MIIKITNDEDIEEFKKNTDLSTLVVQIPIPFSSVILDWNTVQSTLMYKMFENGPKFGGSEFRVDYSFYYGYKSKYPRRIWFRYNNARFSIDLDPIQNHMLPCDITMTAHHLRKNKERKIPIVLIDNIYYFELNWGELYSEVIRINNRVKNTSKKKEIRSVGYSLKLLSLQGKLIEDGVDVYVDKDNYTGGCLRTEGLFNGCNLTLRFPDKDNCSDIEVTDDTIVEFFNGRTDITCKYGYAAKFSKNYKEFSDKVKQIGKEDE